MHIFGRVEAVRAAGLVKRFESTRAVDGVDLVARAGRGPRSARAERRRQDDAAADAVRADPPRRRRDRAARPRARRRSARARCTAVGGFVEEPCFYPYLSGRANLTLLARLDGGRPPRRGRRERSTRVGLTRRGGGPGERLLDRDAPAARDRRRPAALAAPAAARRADQRPRPCRRARGRRARTRARRRRRRGAALEPSDR